MQLSHTVCRVLLQFSSCLPLPHRIEGEEETIADEPEAKKFKEQVCMYRCDMLDHLCSSEFMYALTILLCTCMLACFTHTVCTYVCPSARTYSIRAIYVAWVRNTCCLSRDEHALRGEVPCFHNFLALCLLKSVCILCVSTMVLLRM